MKNMYMACVFLAALLIATTAFISRRHTTKASLTKKWETKAVLNVPESVLYDPSKKVLYVSNINGQPGGKDGNGFISKISVEGKVENVEWVKGLDAPKGMAVYNNKLFIADLANIVIVNTSNGSILKTIPVEGASFLNDVTVDDKGVVYVSDSETKRIYTVQNEAATLWMEDTTLQMPNGLLASGKELLLLDMNGGVFYKVDMQSKKKTSIAEGVKSGDGIVSVGKNEYLVSNWNGEISYVNSKGEVELLLDTKADKINAADIEYIPAQKLLLIPTFFDNKVVAYTLTK